MGEWRDDKSSQNDIDWHSRDDEKKRNFEGIWVVVDWIVWVAAAAFKMWKSQLGERERKIHRARGYNLNCNMENFLISAQAIVVQRESELCHITGYPRPGRESGEDNECLISSLKLPSQAMWEQSVMKHIFPNFCNCWPRDDDNDEQKKSCSSLIKTTNISGGNSCTRKAPRTS